VLPTAVAGDGYHNQKIRIFCLEMDINEQKNHTHGVGIFRWVMKLCFLKTKKKLQSTRKVKKFFSFPLRN
jgi:hypothetical protein